MTKKVDALLIGCGAMGSALLQGWLNKLKNFEFHVVDPKADKIKGATFHKDLKDLPAKYTPDVIILAVKPQDLLKVLPWCKDHLVPKKTIILSIVAAKKLEFYADNLNYTQPIIRSVPNISAMIQQSTTLLAANAHTTKAQRQIATRLMGVFGSHYWMGEHQLDSLLPLTSSGPAYIFLWAEYLISCISRKGIEPEVARQMATDIILGSAQLMQQTGSDPLKLRSMVTSPKGVTEAALNVFIPALQHLLNNALDAAVKRSDEIAAEGAIKHEPIRESAFD